MLAVLYHQSTGPTGRALARALGATWRGKEPKNNTVYDVVLRWGSSMGFPAKIELNPAQAIRRSADKLVAYNCFNDAGVSVMPFTDSYDEAHSWGEVLVYGRKRHGSGGRDIVLLDKGVGNVGALSWNRCPLYTKGIPIHREYRIHVVGDEVIKVQGKYLDIPADDKSGGRVCNHANGYRFKTPQKTLHKSRLDDAIKAVKSLGLDFGAVDLIIGKDNKHYILEVNTGPACAPATLVAYTDAIQRLIERQPHE